MKLFLEYTHLFSDFFSVIETCIFNTKYKRTTSIFITQYKVLLVVSLLPTAERQYSRLNFSHSHTYYTIHTYIYVLILPTIVYHTEFHTRALQTARRQLCSLFSLYLHFLRAAFLHFAPLLARMHTHTYTIGWKIVAK